MPKVVLDTRFFFVSQHVSTVPAFLDTARMNVDAIQDVFLQHVAMVVERGSQDRSMSGAVELEGCKKDKQMFQRLTFMELARRIVLEERNPWLMPIESCESEETEVEEVKLFRAPPSLLDPLIEETKLRESGLGCQIDVTATVGSRLHPRYQQVKEARPAEGIVNVKISDELSDHNAPLNPKLERGTKERQSCKQRCGVFPRDFPPRGGDALP